MAVPQIILDTDFSSDCDDVLDLKACWLYHMLGEANLLGVMCCTSNQYAPGAIQGALNWLGGITPTIGTWRGAAFDPSGPGSYTSDFYSTYTHSLGLANTVTSATTQLRTLLAARSSADVTIVMTGFAKNIRDLLDSAADGVSALTGAQLIAASVKELVIVAGFWPSSATHGGGSAEFNLVNDAANYSYLVANWPSTVPLTFAGVEIGDVVGKVGLSLPSTVSSSDPARKALTDFGVLPTPGREAWGNIGVIHAVLRGFLRIAGTATVNSSTGANSFTASSSGAHGYLVTQTGTITTAGLAAYIEKLITASNSSPFVSAWGTQAWAKATVG